MKIGLFVSVTDSSLDPAVLAQRAEALGFESFWVSEHSLIPVHTTSDPFRRPAEEGIPPGYAHIVDPFVALARASAVTETIKLGTGVCLVPEHNPLRLAKEVATLDHFSGGRFIFGIGSGWLKEETEIMGGDFPHRWTQTKDAVMAMKELWTKELPEYHGRYFDFPPVHFSPKPAQKPHPPIFLGGSAKNVFKRVVEWADGWMPTKPSVEEIEQGRKALDGLAAQVGRDPASIEVVAFGRPGLFRDRTIIDDLFRAGANRVVIRLDPSGGPEALTTMEEIAGRAGV
ncbi:MAG: LLM class F420-dependent oxidoreductase [Dehalococcoidia bacterium]|nr:LLM class F420-dependent oxidoreductase [Dehalococcoidia bacterium]